MTVAVANKEIPLDKATVDPVAVSASIQGPLWGHAAMVAFKDIICNTFLLKYVKMI